MIKVTELRGRKDRRRFIHLPATIHKNHSNWVPPIYMDERQLFNPGKNKSFGYCDTILLLAWKDGHPVGRIMGIINHRYNTARKEDNARFSWMECDNDPEVAKALLSAVESWAKEKGMIELVGPMGFSDKDPQGLMVEGFDKPIVIATNCNFPYLADLVEENGFRKKIDLVVYKIDIPAETPELYRNISARIMESNGLEVMEFTKRKELKAVIRPVLGLMNETFRDIYGYDIMEPEEMDDFAARYIPLLDPRFIKVIRNPKKEVVAFVIGMPDLSQGIIKSKGYLFPIGIIQILRSGKKTKQLNLLLGAIREDYRNKGLDAVMGVRMLKSSKEAGLEYIDSHLELEDNLKVRKEMERMGGQVYKRYRIYQKTL